MKSESCAAGDRVRWRIAKDAVASRRGTHVASIGVLLAVALLAQPLQVRAQKLEDDELFVSEQGPAAATSPESVSLDAQKASGDEVAARTDYLIARLDARRRHATWWYRSWFAVYAGGFAFSTLRASLANGDLDRTDNIVSGVKSTIGIADLLLRPIEARHGADAIRALPGETEAQRLVRLEAAEKLLESNAKRASHARDLRVHLSSLGLNLAGAGALLALGSPKRAAVSFGIGEVFSELAIYTQPVTPAEDWDDYQTRTSTRNWTLSPTGIGLAFQSTF